MKTVLKIFLFVIGFPALIALTVISSLTVFKEGNSYGFWVFIGLILAAVFFLAYLITFIVTEVKNKKSGTRKVAKKGLVALVIVAFIFTSGLWFVIDVLLPGILDDATSGTLLFDDVRENYEDQAKVNAELLNKFITINYNNGNLDKNVSLSTYLEEGYKNERIKTLIHTNFTNIDQNGYASYTATGPWIGLADGKRMTIPVLIHLLFNERDIKKDLPYLLKYDYIPKEVTVTIKDEDGNIITQDPDGYSPYYNLEEREDPEGGVTWTVLDMDGNPMEIKIGELLEGTGLSSFIIGIIKGDTGTSIINTLRNIVADENVLGAPIYISIHVDEVEPSNTALVLGPSNTSRGMLGYKNSAWLNSNHLLFAVISIFPARIWLLIWGAMVVATSVTIGVININSTKADDEGVEDEYDEFEDYQPKVIQYDDSDVYNDPNLSPYERAYIIAQRNRERRG
ncbi:MAG TPA: hypothetical protein PKX91_01665 [Clostridia bacterium]|jgi:heme/copper-type cytochrome/quinol oxidase subunit 4|nr:hypothetical protein [Clostridia bacterium]